jgi:DNA-directed RNA polymerase specialized sigma subunit
MKGTDEMSDKEKIIEMLKSYPQKKRQIEQLRFELAHPAEIGGDELIGALSLGGRTPEERIGRGGFVSDRTMRIAVRYRDIAEEMNAGAIARIAGELRALEAETERLEHRVSLLCGERQTVIRRRYFEGAGWADIENETNLSRRGLFRCRDAAIEELADMYSFLSEVKSDADADTPEG